MPDKSRNALFWTLAVILTFVGSFVQRQYNRENPVKEVISINGTKINYFLPKIYTVDNPQPVLFFVKNKKISGFVKFSELYGGKSQHVIRLKRKGNFLYFRFKDIPVGKKIKYSVLFEMNGIKKVLSPGNMILTSVKSLPPGLNTARIFFLFLALLLGIRAGLESLNPVTDHLKYLISLTLLSFFIGGFILEGIRQYLWFHSLPGLLDISIFVYIKVLIVILFWTVAWFKVNKKRSYGIWVSIATILMFLVYLTPPGFQ